MNESKATCIIRSIKGCLVAPVLLYVFLMVLGFLSMKGPGSRSANFVMVSFKDGNIVFYSSGGYEFSSLPSHTGIFNIKSRLSATPDRHRQEYWEIDRNDMCTEKKCSWKVCEPEESNIYFAKITYGKVPKCYHEVIPPAKIRKGDLYEVGHSNIPDRYEVRKVSFIIEDCRKIGIGGCLKKVSSGMGCDTCLLAGCDDNAEKTCLFTNSPASLDIEQKYKRIMEYSMKE